MASPHTGCCAALLCVTCFQSPMRPAHTSGGAFIDSRTAAAVWPSLAAAKLGRKPKEWRPLIPRHSASIVAVFESRTETAEPPPDHSVNRMRSGAVHVSELGDVLRPGVRFTGAPPPAAIVN